MSSLAKLCRRGKREHYLTFSTPQRILVLLVSEQYCFSTGLGLFLIVMTSQSKQTAIRFFVIEN